MVRPLLKIRTSSVTPNPTGKLRIPEQKEKKQRILSPASYSLPNNVYPDLLAGSITP